MHVEVVDIDAPVAADVGAADADAADGAAVAVGGDGFAADDDVVVVAAAAGADDAAVAVSADVVAVHDDASVQSNFQVTFAYVLM